MIKHPIKEQKLNNVDLKTGLPIFYTDIYMSYLIGDVVRYWTDEIIKNGILLDDIITKDGVEDNAYYRPYYKDFPWNVTIIHMSSIKESIYKINFNIKSTIDKNIFSYYTLNEKQNKFINNFFKGDWVDYVDNQGSRIIVEFDLDKYYYLWSRTVKLQKIKNNIKK